MVVEVLRWKGLVRFSQNVSEERQIVSRDSNPSLTVLDRLKRGCSRLLGGASGKKADMVPSDRSLVEAAVAGERELDEGKSHRFATLAELKQHLRDTRPS